jgi:hypothetical protein
MFDEIRTMSDEQRTWICCAAEGSESSVQADIVRGTVLALKGTATQLEQATTALECMAQNS